MAKLNITKRDTLLLEALHDFGLMSSGQIERRIFPGIKRTTMLRRLRALEKGGLIQNVSGLERGELAWFILAKGGALVGNPNGFGQVNKNTLHHDILVSSLRMRLEEIGVSQGWKSGHELKKAAGTNAFSDAIIPDGIMIFNGMIGTGALGVELELSAKAQGRYESVLDEYQKKKSLAGVWYIVPNPRIGKLVLMAEAKITSSNSRKDFVFWSQLDEIFADPAAIRLRASGKTYFLKDIMKIALPVTPEKSPAQSAAHTLSKEAEIAESEKSAQVPERILENAA